MKGSRQIRRGEAILAGRLLGIINSSWMSQAIYVAARLELAEHLAQGPRTAAELAAVTNSNEPALYRLLRALTTLSICEQRSDGTFAMTALGALLGSESSCSVRSWAMQWGGSSWWTLWGHLYESVKTGNSARSLLSATEGFDDLKTDVAGARIFNDAMVELTRLVALNVVQVYDFRGKRVVDVGGGYGELLAVILEACGDARGILFDLPHAIAEARRRFAERNLTERCEFIEGDFFRKVPAGADVYVLKTVIHDWNDDNSRSILQTCRRAMRSDSRLLLVERIMPPRLGRTPEHQALAHSDLNVLVGLGAPERTEAQFDRLLEGSGLRKRGQQNAGPMFAIIEAEVEPSSQA